MAPEILEATLPQYPYMYYITKLQFYNSYMQNTCFDFVALTVHPSYDERSDVWSLGCIILEMATCGFMDVRMLLLHLLNFCVCVHSQQAEMSTLLFQLKGSPQIIEDVLENVSKVIYLAT